MTQDFDHIASTYDSTFTNTQIGKYQRTLVYEFLTASYQNLEGKKVLEINGGTGEDAQWLLDKKAILTFTDISPEMVDFAEQKSKSYNQPLSSHVLDINELDKHYPKPTFDLVFSNFGGLNCLNEAELALFFKHASNALNPGGELILVIMPSFCAWETAYFLAKLQFTKAFRRRNKNGVNAHVEGKFVKTYYYSPKHIEDLTNHYFHAEEIKPVGFYIPPSYLEPFFKKRSKWLSRLWKKEKRIKKYRRLSFLSDHYYIRLSKKG